ncbi:hypothetical protein [Bradyrhizobium sp.]|uniref:hypothetical protein n=1 Tax=Bradyrhizobium sp. TaxID=376 RepID=UPI003C6F5631
MDSRVGICRPRIPDGQSDWDMLRLRCTDPGGARIRILPREGHFIRSSKMKNLGPGIPWTHLTISWQVTRSFVKRLDPSARGHPMRSRNGRSSKLEAYSETSVICRLVEPRAEGDKMTAKSHGGRSWKDDPKAKAIAATISLLLIVGLIAMIAVAFPIAQQTPS